jgi:hypothetical protein
MQETTPEGADARMVKHGHKMTALEIFSNAKLDIIVLKSLLR